MKNHNIHKMLSLTILMKVNQMQFLELLDVDYDD